MIQRQVIHWFHSDFFSEVYQNLHEGHGLEKTFAAGGKWMMSVAAMFSNEKAAEVIYKDAAT